MQRKETQVVSSGFISANQKDYAVRLLLPFRFFSSLSYRRQLQEL
jgi:hypothetical protein